MGKRKSREEKQQQQPINSAPESDENGEEGGGKGGRFFACYLLTSLCPRFKGHTYIGYTLNPRRRIRQHNGEIGSGAWRTKKRRPWEMVLCIYGFPTNIAALQFEWAWQHPVESLAVRSAAASFKSLNGLANKIKLAYTMLTLPAWQSLNLTVNLFSTKYQMYTSACPKLPEQMRTKVCSMDDLPCYNVNACENDICEDDDDDVDDDEGLLQESTEEESTSAARKGEDSPSRNDSSEENIHRQMNNRNDEGAESSGCLAKTRVEKEKSFIINDSPARASTLLASSYTANSQIPSLIELTSEFDQPVRNQRTNANKDEMLMKSHEVEIIDCFTPSPCYHVNGNSKKRRPTVYPEIIDLTNSPMYV